MEYTPHNRRRHKAPKAHLKNTARPRRYFKRQKGKGHYKHTDLTPFLKILLRFIDTFLAEQADCERMPQFFAQIKTNHGTKQIREHNDKKRWP